MRKLRAVTVVLLGAVLALPLALSAADPPRPPAAAGTEACRDCHPQHTLAFEQSVHGSLKAEEWGKGMAAGCEGCHGPAIKHAADPKDRSKVPWVGDLKREQKDRMCTVCHTGMRLTQMNSSAHGRDLACVECHDPHRSSQTAMLRADETTLCGDCHAEQRAKLSFPSHHPVGEGKMRCSDCHLAHGGTHQSLREEEGNALCARCHASYQGPFLYDHPPVVEDCKICHDPHGSVNNNLLTQSEPFLCLFCHGQHENFARPAASDARFAPAFNTKCTQCHPAVHGGDFPGEAGKGRQTR